MAAARLDVAAVFLYAGTALPGLVTLSDGSQRELTIIDAFEAVGACAVGPMAWRTSPVRRSCGCSGRASPPGRS